MWCAACCAHPQLAAQPEWIAGITNIKWFKIDKHQKCGTHAVSLALWRSGGRVRHVSLCLWNSGRPYGHIFVRSTAM